MEENPAVVARVRDVQTGADQVAGRLAVTPDRVAGEDDELAALLSKDELAY